MGFLDSILGGARRRVIEVPRKATHVQDIIPRSVRGDIGENLSGIGPMISMTGKALIHDSPFMPFVAIPKAGTNVIRGRSPFAGFDRPTATANLAGQMAAGGFGYQARALGEDPKDAPVIMGPDGTIYRNKRGGGLAYLLPMLPDVPKSVLEDARSEPRGLDLLKEDPLNVPLAFAPLAGMAGKGVLVGKLASNIQKANKGMRMSEARRLAKREISQPGYAERHGHAGGIEDRVIKGQYGEAPGRMRSRSSLGRGFQRSYDALSEAIDARNPERRFSSSTRAQSAQNKMADRVAKRNENAITQVEILLKKAMGRDRMESIKNAPLTEDQQSIMSAIVVALEHGDMTVEEAVNARIKLYESVLSGGVSSSMTEGTIAKLGAQLEHQMDDVTQEQRGVLSGYAQDLRRAQRQADVAEARARNLALRRTPEERQAIRDRLGLNPSVKRSEAEFVKLDERLAKLKREHEDLTTKIEDLLTAPNMPPSRRNRGLSSATRQLQKKNDQLVKTRKELRDALAWGHDVSDEVRRHDYVVDIAEGNAENRLRGARRGEEAARRRVQLRERRLGDRQESSEALLVDERKALDQAFDDMVANPRQSRPVTAVERHQIEASMAELKRALENPIDTEEFRMAVEGMRQLAKWVDDTGRDIAKMGLSEEDASLLDSVFDERQNLIGNEMVRRKILTPEQAGGAYFPHYSIWQNAGKEVGRGHGVHGPIVDAPNLNDFILNMHENDLQLMQAGMVDMSATTLGNVLRNRLRYLSTHEAVTKLYNEGDAPLEDMSNMGKGWALIRNPNAAKRKVPDRMAMGLTDPRKYWENVAKEEHPTPYSDEVEARADLSQREQRKLAEKSAEEARLRANAESADPDGTDADFDHDMGEAIYFPGSGPAPEWVKTTRNFRVVPVKVAKARLGEAVMRAPDSDTLAALNAANLMIRASILYSPYGGTRYVTRNAIQNATLLALTHPGSFKNFTTAARMYARGAPEEKALFREIAVEGGTVAAEAGLPDVSDRNMSTMRKGERRIASGSAKAANALGDVADEPFRVAAWIGYAKRYDFDTPDEWRELIHDPKHAKLRDEISQRVREDLYDFDAASPMERRYLNKILFLYPFLRASMKWPFMYAREYPVRTAVGATLAHEAPQDDEYTNIPQSVKESSTEGGLNWGIWDPTGPARQQFENAQSIVRGTMHDQGGEGALDNLHPLLGLGADWAQGDPILPSLKRLIPFERSIEDAKRGGLDFSKQSEMFMGMEVRPPAHIRKEYGQMADKINATIAWQEGLGKSVDASKIQPTFTAWKEWKAIDYRAKRAAKDQGKNFGEEDIAVLYAQFLSKYGVKVPTEAQLREANSAQREVWTRKMNDLAWKPLTDPVQDMRDRLRNLMMKGWTLDQIKTKTGIDVGMFEEDLK